MESDVYCHNCGAMISSKEVFNNPQSETESIQYIWTCGSCGRKKVGVNFEEATELKESLDYEKK